MEQIQDDAAERLLQINEATRAPQANGHLLPHLLCDGSDLGASFDYHGPDRSLPHLAAGAHLAGKHRIQKCAPLSKVEFLVQERILPGPSSMLGMLLLVHYDFFADRNNGHVVRLCGWKKSSKVARV